MESESSGVWNCVIGKSFGSHVLHMTKAYVFGKIYKHHVLLWRAGS
jgi:dynein light chain LC8-type